MATTSSRLGTTDNSVELDKRLLAIEDQLNRTALANVDAANTAIPLTTALTVPPAVTGLSLISGPSGAIAMRWSPTTISNLLYYEIQISDLPSFSSIGTLFRYTVNLTQFTFAEGLAGAHYYARVRAVNIRGDPGDWSITLDTFTGLATTVVQAPALSSFSPNHIGRTNYNDPDFDSGSIDYTISSIPLRGAKTLPYSLFKFQYAAGFYLALPTSNPVNNLRVIITENIGTASAIVRADETIDFFSTVGDIGSLTFPYANTMISAIVQPFDVVADTHVYTMTLRVQCGHGCFLDIIPLELDFNLIQIG